MITASHKDLSRQFGGMVDEIHHVFLLFCHGIFTPWPSEGNRIRQHVRGFVEVAPESFYAYNSLNYN